MIFFGCARRRGLFPNALPRGYPGIVLIAEELDGELGLGHFEVVSDESKLSAREGSGFEQEGEENSAKDLFVIDIKNFFAVEHTVLGIFDQNRKSNMPTATA